MLGQRRIVMAKSSKLVAAKRGRVLLVRRRRDGLWMFPGGRRRGRETEKDCLHREIREELPKLKLGRLKLWKEVKAKNPRSGRKMSDAIFIANKASGWLAIGDKQEINKATWHKPRPRGIRLTPTSRTSATSCSPSEANYFRVWHFPDVARCPT
jgi:8-oxo-dGTP diphosphatase